MEQPYSVVFDITQAGFRDWTFSAFGLVFVFIGIVLLTIRPWLIKLPRKSMPPAYITGFILCWIGFAVIWTIAAFSMTYSEYRQLREANNKGAYEVVEGDVTDFDPMPYEGHRDERFCVNRTCFSYSDYGVTAGFNNTSSHGGPIKSGLRVRIRHVNNVIIRLEVAR